MRFRHIRLTERSLYPEIKRVFEERGAEVVLEPIRVTIPDFMVNWLGERWIVSIKIGDPTQPKTLKDAFVQYISHMRDFKIDYGIIIFYPEDRVRVEKVSAEAVRKIIRDTPAYLIALNPQMELREPLPSALIKVEDTLRRKIPVSFGLTTVVNLLKAHIEELMNSIGLSDHQVVKIVSDPKLFFGVNPVEKDERKRKEVLKKASTFLAAYIFLSQAFFLRLYCEERPTFIEGVEVTGITRDEARKLFDKVKGINYRPIFEIDVLDSIDERLIQDTFKLLFGLQTKNIRYELPGRLFHELMPREIRKLLAAFYTRPIAAHLLAQLTINDCNNTVFDPACGSGTILTMAYRRKLELWKGSERPENPHKVFCEEQLYGCDIMPFAVHLTNANLAAMDPLTRIDLTQVALGDSLKLTPNIRVQPGYMMLTEFMPGEKWKEEVKANAFKRTGEPVEITLRPVDVILMNPPFTKVERGVREYIDTSKFEQLVGREVGLWGYFIALADIFLKEEGVLGAVLPINLLRGRESEQVRNIIFRKWFPLYVVKAAMNYGFSEYAEYRDILMIAKKLQKKPEDHMIKFCIIKKDLNKLTDDEARWIAEQIKSVDKLRSDLLDIDSHPLSDLIRHFGNMMPFISGPSLKGKDALRRIIEGTEKSLSSFPRGYFREGYGPRPKGVSGFMFVTRPIGEGRTQEAFLILEGEYGDKIRARTCTGVQRFEFNRKHFLPSLRTPVGLCKMDVTKLHDYVANEPYEAINRAMELCEFDEELPADYWSNYVNTEFRRSSSYAAVIRRINPYSPNQMLIAYYSEVPLILANVFHVVNEENSDHAKAVTAILNSILFLAYFFNIKEETTGRYTELRHYDLYEMKLYPSRSEQVKKLVEVYEKYKDKEFPALRRQLDVHFDRRYEWFWRKEREKQEVLQPPPPVEPHGLRLEFDMDVIKAVGANLAREDLLRAYEAIVWDMIITRGLSKD